MTVQNKGTTNDIGTLQLYKLWYRFSPLSYYEDHLKKRSIGLDSFSLQFIYLHNYSELHFNSKYLIVFRKWMGLISSKQYKSITKPPREINSSYISVGKAPQQNENATGKLKLSLYIQGIPPRK
jgi:hypothetical protein